MKITEVSARIMNALREKEFIGEFEVTIFHPDMADVKIAGQMKDVALGSDFSSKLQNKINEICFQIVSSSLLLLLRDKLDMSMYVEYIKE